ncbi:MAG: CoA pyrophosphatase [Flavobacteriales bacterium]|nr:CoA pyrophosphatase [Flavobacteriales bacterium]
MITSLKAYLSERLKQELPGRIAHIEAAPYRRIEFDEKELSAARKSGVLVLFYAIGKEPYIALMQRPVYEGTHSGQVSFPGGKQEESDRDIEHTALREANEEVGVIMEDVEVIGQLSDVYIPVSKFNVSPVIGFVDYHPQFIIDNHEVEELIELKLSDLTDINELEITKIKLSNNTVLKAPSFVFNQKIVWGATALILNELRHILKEWKS